MKAQRHMILGQGIEYSLDTRETKRNNNVLVVGASGAGKTRSIVSPNLLEATGSYIVSDPKGNLYYRYKTYLENRGYRVIKLDFTDPLDSVHYNFLSYIKEPKDIIKAAHMLIYEEKCVADPFWDQSASMLLSALIAFCIEDRHQDCNFAEIEKLAQMARRDESYHGRVSILGSEMEEYENKYPNSWAVKQFRSVNVAPDRTFDSILISLLAKLRNYNTEEMAEMMSSDEVDITSIGKKKTALFVVVSDSDRSMDNLANLFFTQAINELCRFADNECRDCRLPIPVRIIMDDFATNCLIDDFPRMIASIRSREISTMLMIQAESQLNNAYGEDGRTIIGNCDTYVYLGGTDVETAKAVAERLDVPLRKVLSMPIGSNIIFRRGEKPIQGMNVDLEECEKAHGFVINSHVKQKKTKNIPLAERLSGKKNLEYENSPEFKSEEDHTWDVLEDIWEKYMKEDDGMTEGSAVANAESA